MTAFVLIHGAWHGAWCWQRVIDHLRAAGHDAGALTLSGLAERADLLSRQIDLSAHIEDVIAHVRASGWKAITMVGHSYGGFPATAAAARLGDLVSHLVLLDAFLPQDGEKLLDHAPHLIEAYTAHASRDENWHIPPLPSVNFGVADADRAWVDERLTAQPVGTYFEPIRLPPLSVPDRTYIRCTQAPGALLERSAFRARADGWRYVEIDAPHDAMLTHPELLAAVIADGAS
ncbi:MULTISPECIES: alpha/beta fold hydrolase [Rhizobium/Agrobacterium group]|uniref:Alpha/beta hydrolase family protein n=1 Tax=Rhizobium subbaraonis TaxID=908946 RepID=A0A285UYI4_9HYPH|nr:MULTISPECIES: alpha/beta fold hydrolase [Rhizobium/Agrobacterium group]MDH0871657.1 alpha/beta fold hydrolase [Agrobacterium pusense]WLS06912.1 alpha/beta fold hydrolase [Shinella sumterensis]CDN94504.1 Putative hydrolase or acyltransferase of alpha/beta superfamily precursor [Agrobacterium tumefaciens]SOC46882.1 alpha/beta hydrolase family protein [Rhizobium subbaraonis]